MATDPSKHTQCDMLIEHFSRGKPITQIEALNLYGILRLASRVNDLKSRGYKVYKQMIPVKTRYAGTAYVAQYSFTSYLL